MQESMPALFQYDSTEQAMLACAEPHVNINYMHAPDFELQQQFLEHYMETVAKPSKERSLTLVLSVGYWVWTPEVPQVRAHLPPPRACSLPRPGGEPMIVMHRSGWLDLGPKAGPAAAQEYLDSLVALSERVHRIILLSIPTVHTLAHTGKQVSRLGAPLIPWTMCISGQASCISLHGTRWAHQSQLCACHSQ